jgi:hypothetical protein
MLSCPKTRSVNDWRDAGGWTARGANDKLCDRGYDRDGSEQGSIRGTTLFVAGPAGPKRTRTEGAGRDHKGRRGGARF